MAARKRKVSENHEEKRSISARTDEQKEYIKALIQNDIVICCGRAGSGKTCVAAGIAADFLKRNLVDKIIVSRPCIGTEDLGYLPGEYEEKIAPFLAPLYTELEAFLNVRQCITQGKIQILPASYMRGVTFKNAFVIIDEVQNLNYRQLRMILTRLGENSKLVLTGDTTQSDLSNKENKDLEKIIKKMTPIATLENKIAIVKLSISIRHPLVEKIESVLAPEE